MKVTIVAKERHSSSSSSSQFLYLTRLAMDWKYREQRDWSRQRDIHGPEGKARRLGRRGWTGTVAAAAAMVGAGAEYDTHLRHSTQQGTDMCAPGSKKRFR